MVQCNQVGNRLVFIDIESAGLFNVNAGKIEITKPLTQIAALAVCEDGNELEAFEAKVKFDEASADTELLQRSHYDAGTWALEAKEPNEVARLFARFLRRHASIQMVSKTGKRYRIAQLVAHNAERFDGPLIHAWFEQRELFCPAAFRVFCTKQRAFWFFHECQSVTPPANFQLSSLCRHFGIPFNKNKAHDALYDVRATAKLYRTMAHD